MKVTVTKVSKEEVEKILKKKPMEDTDEQRITKRLIGFCTDYLRGNTSLEVLKKEIKLTDTFLEL